MLYEGVVPSRQTGVCDANDYYLCLFEKQLNKNSSCPASAFASPTCHIHSESFFPFFAVRAKKALAKDQGSLQEH